MGQIVVSIQFAHPELGATLEKPGPHIDPWHDQSLEWIPTKFGLAGFSGLIIKFITILRLRKAKHNKGRQLMGSP